jgi:hypothetical protein
MPCEIVKRLDSYETRWLDLIALGGHSQDHIVGQVAWH